MGVMGAGMKMTVLYDRKNMTGLDQVVITDMRSFREKPE